jgi:PIN domain nuclease of toxin-antitoxin system
MKLQLDTQALLWWLGDSAELGERARSAIGEGNNLVFVSAASAWEIEIKRALGKLDAPENLAETLAGERFIELPVSSPPPPSERCRVCTGTRSTDAHRPGRSQHLTVVTSDAMFARYRGPSCHVTRSACAKHQYRRIEMSHALQLVLRHNRAQEFCHACR